MISIIVAVASNHAIGRNNQLLWHISQDLQYFKQVTKGHCVIMGRKTFESLGEKPLPARRNIVITRHSRWEDAEPQEGRKTALNIVPSLEDAIALAQSHSPEGGECFIIGGGQVYAEALPQANRLYITEVDTDINDADTFFPEIDQSLWQKESVSETYHDEETGYNFRFVVYSRIRSSRLA